MLTTLPTLGRPVHGLARWATVGASLPMGLGALGGGFALMRDAEGFGMLPEWIEGSIFPDYAIPGLFLFVVIGGGMLVTAGLALAGSPLTAVSAFAMGAILLMWLAIETAIVGWQGGPQLNLLLVCGGAAVVLIAASASALRQPVEMRR